ncbi:MAG TPA: hypothetical protein VFQ61_01595 [Polyangiaceae bacterium]|nr:hypothetical protein [Polyangiaceae bacterium]
MSEAGEGSANVNVSSVGLLQTEFTRTDSVLTPTDSVLTPTDSVFTPTDSARSYPLRVGRRPLAIAALGLLFGLAAPAGIAPAHADERRPEKAERYRRPVPSQSIEAGCARLGVNASLETVRKVVNDFDRYASFVKRYKDGRLQLQVTAKLLGRSGEKKDVYLEVPILRGTSKVWGMLRFDPVKVVGDEEILEGHLLKGNVERLDARWRLRRIEAGRTLVALELLIVPKVPVPRDVVTGELEFVSDVSVSGVRNEAERIDAP